MIDELKQMIAAAQRPSGVMQAVVQDLTGELSKLAALRDSGILTDEEFSAAKAKLLS
jgi:tagatose-1,6-bisphosphate aldolase